MGLGLRSQSTETMMDKTESRARRLQHLAYQAYWVAATPTEAKMAGILVDLFGVGSNDCGDDTSRPVHRLFAYKAQQTAERAA